MRQAPEPLPQQGGELGRREAVAQGLQPRRIGAGQDPVVQGLVRNPPLGELPLDVLVPVHTQLGRVREVGPELQEERPKVPIDGVEVHVVYHRRGSHQPGVALPRPGIHALLRPEYRRLLLGLADEDDALVALEAGQLLGHHVVLPLALRERDQRHAVLRHEDLDRRDEGLADRIHQRRGGERVATMRAEEVRHPALVLQLRHVDVEVHPVDALDLERRVLGEDLARRCVVESWLAPVDGGPSWTNYPLGGLMSGSESMASRCPSAGAPLRLAHAPALTIHLVGLRRSLVRTWASWPRARSRWS